MRITGALLGVAAVTLFSGCMMVPMAHTGDSVGLAAAAQSRTGQNAAMLGRAQARGDGLDLVLSYRTPSGGATAFDAQLRTDGDPQELLDAEIRLRIRSPDGGVEQLAMRRVPSHATAQYHGAYRFPAVGSYLVTAEARTGVETYARTISVTTEVNAQDGSHHDQNDWLVPVAILGGLGTMVWMALMMGGSWF